MHNNMHTLLLLPNNINANHSKCISQWELSIVTSSIHDLKPILCC